MEVEKLYSASDVLQRMVGSVVLGAVFAAQNSFVLLLFLEHSDTLYSLSGAFPCDIYVFPHPSETEKRFLFGNLKTDVMSVEIQNLGECVDDEDDDDEDEDDDVDDNDVDEDDYSGEGSDMDSDDDDMDSDDEVQTNGDGGSDDDDGDDDDEDDDDDDDDKDEDDDEDDDSDKEVDQRPPKKKK